MSSKRWEADPSADLSRRWGKSSHELGNTSGDGSCPDIWELANGDVAVIGQDLTEAYRTRLPAGVSVGTDVMYEAVYDDAGVLAAARRWLDRDLVVRCQRFIADLYRDGEPLDEFFVREVASLEPPGGQ